MRLSALCYGLNPMLPLIYYTAMNRIFLFMIMMSVIALIFTAPDKMLPSALEAAGGAATFCIGLVAMYAIWLGLLKIAEATGINKFISKLLRPIVRFLFGKVSDETSAYISMNMSANILGLGNAATPMGINAIRSMDDGSGTATQAMVMLMVINATSLQLIPTTILGLRASAGSSSPADIVLPTIISSLTSFIVGVFLVKLVYAVKRKKNGAKL